MRKKTRHPADQDTGREKIQKRTTNGGEEEFNEEDESLHGIRQRFLSGRRITKKGCLPKSVSLKGRENATFCKIITANSRIGTRRGKRETRYKHHRTSGKRTPRANDARYKAINEECVSEGKATGPSLESTT